MNKIFLHNLKFLEFINELGKICFLLEKMKFRTNHKFGAYGRRFGLRKGPEQEYQLFDVLPKQAACQIKTLQLQVYIQSSDFMKSKELNLRKFQRF